MIRTRTNLHARLILGAAAATTVHLCASIPAFAQDTVKTTPWTLHEALGAPDELKLNGSVRLRYETIDGQARTGFNPSSRIVSLRTRLAAEYEAGALRFGAELYDSRAFNAEPGDPVTNNEVNTLEFVQAYVGASFDAPFGAGSKVSAQLGRYILNLGSRRIVAADDYRNTTNGYTGLRLDGQWAGGTSATLFYVLPQTRLPEDFASLSDNEVALDREGSDQQLFGGLFTVPAGLEKASLQVSYYGFREEDRDGVSTRDRDLDTLGVRYFRDPAAGAFDFDIETFVQGGSVSASTAAAAATLDVSAWYLRAEAGYQWDAPWRPRLAIEYDYASGDKPGGDFGRFDTLFGMRRAELAPSGINAGVARANLDSPAIRLEIKPDPRWEGFVTFRSLRLASATDAFSTTGVRDATGASGSFAGNQFELHVRHWLVPESLRLEANLYYLDKGRFLKTAPNANAADDTAYLEVDISAFF